MKIEITTLTDLFTVIKKQVDDSNIPAKQKRRTTNNIQAFAKQAFDLGSKGKIELEVKE